MSENGPTIKLVLLWHMHQPFYKDMVSGEYRLPWVRLHALKDYYGMVKLLDEFPQVHQNFNLVPSLLVQLQDYVSGAARDPFLGLVSKPATELTAADRQFALHYLFQANPLHMIGRYPRYRELWERYRTTCDRPEGPESYFRTQDYSDLQVLSQLAWFDEYFLDDPAVAELIRKGTGFGPDDQQTVLAKEREFLEKVIPAYAAAAANGSAELSVTPFYHPILPLLCDTNAGGQSTPGLPLPARRFRRPEDAREQISRALKYHESLFGSRPKGLWPSEGSVSEEAIAIAAREGLDWMATDEEVLGRSMDYHFTRDGSGYLQADGAERLHNIYRYEKGDTRMHLLFRDHRLSDLIGFVYSGMPAQDAANHLIQNIKDTAQPIISKGRDAIVSIMLDGENAWEYYPGSGREFLRRFYDRLQTEPGLQAVTISEAIAQHRESDYGRLERIVPGSWIHANFNVWIGAPEDNHAWDLLTEAREYYDRHAPRVTEAQRKLAWEELLIAEGSDWNWWYGPEHHSANDKDFDELYRKHLANVYHALEGVPPEELSHPLISGVTRPTHAPQTAFVRPRVDGVVSGYFEWMGAASYTSDQRTGAMHGKQFLLDAVYAGVDEGSLAARMDFHEGVPEGAHKLVVDLEVRCGGSHQHTGADRYRLQIEAFGNTLQRWTLTNGDERSVLAGFAFDNGNKNTQGIEAALNEILEVRIPFTAIQAQPGSSFRVRFSVWRNHLPVDSLPMDGWIDLKALPESELEQNLYNFTPE